jgi:hypothetical protein
MNLIFALFLPIDIVPSDVCLPMRRMRAMQSSLANRAVLLGAKKDHEHKKNCRFNFSTPMPIMNIGIV